MTGTALLRHTIEAGSCLSSTWVPGAEGAGCGTSSERPGCSVASTAADRPTPELTSLTCTRFMSRKCAPMESRMLSYGRCIAFQEWHVLHASCRCSAGDSTQCRSQGT